MHRAGPGAPQDTYHAKRPPPLVASSLSGTVETSRLDQAFAVSEDLAACGQVDGSREAVAPFAGAGLLDG